MGGLIDGPANDLKIVFSRFGEQRGRYKVAADRQLTRSNFNCALNRIFYLALEKKASHQRGFNLAQSFKDHRIEGDHDRSSDFAGSAKSADERVFAAPGAGRLQFEIEDDVVLFGEVENLFEGGNSFPCEFAAEPRTCIEAA